MFLRSTHYLPLCLVLATASCHVELAVADGASVLCDAQSDCPSGWTCRTNVGRCVSASGGDNEPPELRGIPSIAPAVVGLGQSFTVLFGVDEALAAPAELRLGGGSGTPLGLASRGVEGSGEAYAFTHTVTETDPTGDVTLSASFIDLFGNAGSATVGQIRIDVEPPSLDGLAWILPTDQDAAGPTDVVSFSAGASIDAQVSGARLLDQHGGVLADLSASVRLVKTTVSATIEGEADLASLALTGVTSLRVELDVEDEVGNRVPAELARTPELVLDLVPPSDGAVVLGGGATTTLDIAITAALGVTGGRDAFISGDVLNDDVTFEWRRLSELPAAVPLTLTPKPIGDKQVCVTFRDGAHNETPPACAIIELLVDSTPPLLTGLTLTTPGIAASRTVGLAFTVSDNRGVVGYAVTETSAAPSPAAFLLFDEIAVGATPVAVDYTMSTGDGPRDLWVWILDTSDVLNQAISNQVSLELDTQPPAITSFTIAGKNANGALKSRSLSVSLSFTDSGSGTKGCAIATSSAQPPATAFVPNCASSAVDFTTDGQATLFAWVMDKAGNVGAPATDSADIDTVAPVVTSFAAPAARYDGVLSIEDFAATDVGLGVWRYALSVDTPCSASTPGYQATPPTVTSTLSAGAHALYGCVIDIAENVGQASITVEHGEVTVEQGNLARRPDVVYAPTTSRWAVAVEEEQDSDPWQRVHVITDTTHIHPEIWLSTGHTRPRLAANDSGMYMVTQTGLSTIWLRHGDFDELGQSVTASQSACLFNCTDLLSVRAGSPDVAVDAANYAYVVWTHSEELPGGFTIDPKSVVLRRFYEAMSFTNPVVLSNDPPVLGEDHYDPAIACGDECVVVWQEQASSKAIRARLVETFNGSLLGGSIVISDTTDATNPAICARGSTVFAVWERDEDIWARKLGMTYMGVTVIGAEFRVNASTTGTQTAPAIACEPSGGFVVVWESADADGGGIFARRFDAAGAPTTGDLAINTTTYGEQRQPSVSAGSSSMDASFVVWTDQSTDPNRIVRRGF